MQKCPPFTSIYIPGKKISEVTFLNGAVARFGENVSVSAPINKNLNFILEQIAAGIITKEEYANKPEKLDRRLRGIQ